MTTALRYLHLTLLLILSLGCIAAAQQPIRPGDPFPELQLKVPTAAEAHEPRNCSWITKVCTTSCCAKLNSKKLSSPIRL